MKKGFTLVDLLIVVVFIGILAAIAIPNYISLVDRARENTIKSVAASALLISVSYYDEHGAYPGVEQIKESDLWPREMPNNPYTGEPITFVPLGFSPGDVGYGLRDGILIFEAYGKTQTSGPDGNGILCMFLCE